MRHRIKVLCIVGQGVLAAPMSLQAHVVSGQGGGVAAIAGFKDLQARLARVEALLNDTSTKGEKP